MHIEERISAFVALQEKLKAMDHDTLDSLSWRAGNGNNWFTLESIANAIQGIVLLLDEPKLRAWAGRYALSEVSNPKLVGVIMAGNIPFVGFHDMLCVLLSGHILLARLSSQDQVLPQYIIKCLLEIEPRFEAQIQITERLNAAQALIATGSDNTAKHFKFYFSKIPHIIRHNRTSVAVLTGQETQADFEQLGKDIFTYYGLGCRNVSKLFVPKAYDFVPLLDALQPFQPIFNHHKYNNNYDYYKSIYLVNNEPHFDTGFLVLKESTALVSPVSVLFYEFYENQADISNKLAAVQDKLQCVVSQQGHFPGSLPFGKAQSPAVTDYADNVDTMAFLTSLVD